MHSVLVYQTQIGVKGYNYRIHCNESDIGGKISKSSKSMQNE